MSISRGFFSLLWKYSSKAYLYFLYTHSAVDPELASLVRRLARWSGSWEAQWWLLSVSSMETPGLTLPAAPPVLCSLSATRFYFSLQPFNCSQNPPAAWNCKWLASYLHRISNFPYCVPSESHPWLWFRQPTTCPQLEQTEPVDSAGIEHCILTIS